MMMAGGTKILAAGSTLLSAARLSHTGLMKKRKRTKKDPLLFYGSITRSY
jgi:hypothetical protein